MACLPAFKKDVSEPITKESTTVIATNECHVARVGSIGCLAEIKAEVAAPEPCGWK